jgi:hypothetical protein
MPVGDFDIFLPTEVLLLLRFVTGCPSKSRRGTTFTIYLPSVEHKIGAAN